MRGAGLVLVLGLAVGGALGGLGLVLFLNRTAPASAPELPQAPAAPRPLQVAQVEKPRFRLDPRERAVLRDLVVDDLQGWAEGGDSMAGRVEKTGRSALPRRVSVAELVRRYQENEVAADAELKGNEVVVPQAEIDSISKDVLDNPFVALKTGRLLEKVLARFSKERTPSLMGLKRGQSVSLLCVVKGLTLQQVVLADCRVLDGPAVSALGDDLMTRLEQALQPGVAPPEGGEAMVLLAVTIARLLPAGCEQGLRAPGCSAEVLMKDRPRFETMLRSVTAELRAAGLTWAQDVQKVDGG